MDLTLLIFQLVLLIFSVMIHEVSHGYVAEKLGDPTARLAGRLNLNPINHLDPFGSFLLPLGLYILTGGAMVFGWAKPVPYNPFNLKNPKAAAGKIAAAGPLSNFLLALVFGLLLRILSGLGYLSPQLFLFFSIIIYINILLGVFNLIPIPPLDGSKVLFALLPVSQSNYALMAFLERYGMILILFFIFFGFRIIVPIINYIYALFVGVPFGF
jgi:Zn-dependent protease